MPTTYRVTRHGAVVASGLSAAQLMAGDHQDDPECEIVEAVVTELRALLGRNPGATEASVRSELRRSIGDSTVLDRAIASGDVVRRGAKLYLREVSP